MSAATGSPNHSTAPTSASQSSAPLGLGPSGGSAGAASLAALMQEKEVMVGRKVGLVLSGGNIDRDLYLDILADG